MNDDLERRLQAEAENLPDRAPKRRSEHGWRFLRASRKQDPA